MSYKLSPSSLSLLKDCPRCFWLQMNKGLRRPDSIFPSLPSGMDAILKKYFDSYMEKGKVPSELKELKGVSLFSEEILKQWRNNLKGIQWTDAKGNLFRGAVDNLLVKGKKLIVLDYKTRGFPLKEDTHEHYKDQMDIYNLLLRKNGRETEDYSYLLFYHPKNVTQKGVVFNTDLIKVDVDIKNAENIFSKAIECLEGKEPKASEECGYCRYVEERK